MIPLRIRALLSSPENDRAVIVLEDAEQRRRLTFSADLHETQRLGRALGEARCPCHPIYDFLDALLGAFQATITHVVLDDLAIWASVRLLRSSTRRCR